jgi:hypothetical protein
MHPLSVRNSAASVSPISMPSTLRNIVAPPIIAVTAHAFNDAHTECLNAGMAAVVVKPFMLEEIEVRTVCVSACASLGLCSFGGGAVGSPRVSSEAQCPSS